MPDYNTAFGSTPAPVYKWPVDLSTRKFVAPSQKNLEIEKKRMEESVFSSGNYCSRAQVSELFPLIPKIVPNSLWITDMINISLDQVVKSANTLLLTQIITDEKIIINCLFRRRFQFCVIGTKGCDRALAADRPWLAKNSEFQ